MANEAGMSEEYKVPAGAPSWWQTVTGQGQEDTPEHRFFKKLFGGGAQAAPPTTPATAPPSGGQAPTAAPSSPQPSAPSPTPEGEAPELGLGSKGVFNSPEDIDKVSKDFAEKAPVKPTLGKAIGGKEAAASRPKLGGALADSKEKEDSNSALMSGLLGWGISTLLTPQWSRGASIYGGIQSGIESHNNYLAQREHEADKDREERLAQAKIDLENAQGQHHLAAAKTAGQTEKLQLELLKNAGKADKGDLTDTLAQTPGLMVRAAIQHAAQGTDLITGKTPVQQVQEAVEAAKQFQAAHAAQTHAQLRQALKQKLTSGTATFHELQTIAPEAILTARSNSKVRENLRMAFKNNPEELAAFDKATK